MKFLATLRRALTFHFLLVALVPTLIFGLVAISLLGRHLREGVYERNLILAEVIASDTAAFLKEVERDLEVVAAAIDAGLVTDSAAIDGLLDLLARDNQHFEAIYLVDGKKKVSHLGLSSRLAPNRDDYRDLDLSRHKLLLNGVPLKAPVWSDTFVSVVSGEPSVTLGLPCRRGTLLGTISLRQLNSMLVRYDRGGVTNIAIVDHAGTLVASLDLVKVLQRTNLSDHPAVSAALHGSVGTILHRHGDVELLESTLGIKSVGWAVWVGIDMNAVMMPLTHLRDLLAGIMLMALLLAGFAALLIARRLMQPLSALGEHTSEISAGLYTRGYEPSGFVEIDTLAASLQGMSLAVRDRESSLVSSEQRFRDLVNSIDGVVWEMDVQSGEYLFVSQKSLELLGYPADCWLDDPGFWSARVHPEDAGRVVALSRRNLDVNNRRDLEYRFYAADDSVVWIRDLVTVVEEGRQAKRLLGVMIDVTRQKANEDELLRYREHLEHLVGERTAELQKVQGELVQRERLAVLGQLTATVSHEIRNPLGTVSNALYLLRETLGNDCLEQADRPLTLAERSVQRCDGIISELLDFTIRRGLMKEAIDLDSWLRELLDETFWPEDVERQWFLDSGLTVQADPERLRRALANVITNALQAIEAKGEGARSLEVTTRRCAGRCEIVVRDSGVGIPDEIRERIYEPMFSTKNFGVGLGVPIIRNIMEDHGGGVEYQSKPGVGTTVTLWLPLEPTP